MIRTGNTSKQSFVHCFLHFKIFSTKAQYLEPPLLNPLFPSETKMEIGSQLNVSLN